MVGVKSKGKLVAYAILVVVLLFGLLQIFIGESKLFFIYQLFGFVVLLLLFFIGLIGYTINWGERVLFFTFLLYIVNLALIWQVMGSLYLVLLFLSLIGFLMSLPHKISYDESGEKESGIDPEPHSMVFDQPQEIPIVDMEKASISKSVLKSDIKKTGTKHSPGKFLASKNSNVYHEPKCEWAKRIVKNRRIWFKNKEEAWEKGYKSHNCVR